MIGMKHKMAQKNQFIIFNRNTSEIGDGNLKDRYNKSHHMLVHILLVL